MPVGVSRVHSVVPYNSKLRCNARRNCNRKKINYMAGITTVNFSRPGFIKVNFYPALLGYRNVIVVALAHCSFSQATKGNWNMFEPASSMFTPASSMFEHASSAVCVDH